MKNLKKKAAELRETVPEKFGEFKDAAAEKTREKFEEFKEKSSELKDKAKKIRRI